MTLKTIPGAAFALAVLLPAVASAQSDDKAYCKALVKKYEQFLDMRGARQPQSLESRVAVEKCKAGDPAGIAPLENALKAARLGLPPRD